MNTQGIEFTVKLTGSSIAEVLAQANKLISGEALATTTPLTGTGPSTKKTKKAAPVPQEDTEADDDILLADGPANAASEDDSLSFDEEEVETPAPKKAKKEKALKLDDVNVAAKAHATANGRQATLALLQKKFKTQSIKEIPETKYAEAIKALAV